MSFFGDNKGTSGWGGFIKQAINNVESHLDKVLDFPEEEGQKAQQNKKTSSERGGVKKAVPLGSSQSRSPFSSGRSTPRIPSPRNEIKDELLKQEATTDKLLVKKSPLKTDVEEKNIEENEAVSPKDIEKDLPSLPADSPVTETTSSSSKSQSKSPISEPTVRPQEKTKNNNVNYKDIAEKRESQLINAIQATSALNETISQLQTDLKNLEEIKAKEESELQKQIEVLKAKTSFDPSILTGDQAKVQKLLEDLQKQIEVKDEQISGLMLEGEKLSKKELKMSTIIQKLRSKEAENEKALADCQKKLGQSVKEVSDYKAKIAGLNTSEKTQNASLRTLKHNVELLSKDKEKLDLQVKKLTESESLAKLNLNKLQQEFKASQKEYSKNQNQNVNGKLEKEMKEKQALADEVVALRVQLDEIEIEHQSTVRGLKQTLSKTQDQFSAREEELQNEINELQLRFTAQNSVHSPGGDNSENVISDIDSAIEAATQPILNRVRTLQSSIHQLQQQLKASERSLREQSDKADSKIANLTSKESKLSAELSEKLELIGELEKKNAELSELVVSLKDQIEQVTTEKNNSDDQLQLLQSEIQTLKSKHSQELKKLGKFYEADVCSREISESNSVRQSLGSADQHSKPSHRRTRSLSAALENFMTNSQAEKPSFSLEASSKDSFTGSLLGSVSEDPEDTSSYDKKFRSLQVQLNSALETRDHLSSELVRVNSKLRNMESELRRLESFETEHKDMSLKYETALVLLGEREEKLNELSSDIREMKEEYKIQITELVSKINQLQT